MQGLRRKFLKVKPNKELDKSMVEITIYPCIPLHMPTYIYICIFNNMYIYIDIPYMIPLTALSRDQKRVETVRARSLKVLSPGAPGRYGGLGFGV